MTAINAYLNRERTKEILSRKPGEEGFSLIELVVVVAVLAILAAIAIPAFVDVNDKARASAASNTLAQVAKECAVKQAQGVSSPTFNIPVLDGYGTISPSTGSCAGGTGDEITFTSDDPTKYPSFTYDVKTGAKTCENKSVQNCSAAKTW